MPALVGGRKSVYPVEFEVIISGYDNVGLVIEMFGFREVLLDGVQGQTGSSRPHVVLQMRVMTVDADVDLVTLVFSQREE